LGHPSGRSSGDLPKRPTITPGIYRERETRRGNASREETAHRVPWAAVKKSTSGAIAAILGAYLVLFPHSRVRLLVFLGYRMGVTRASAVAFLGFWAVMQLFSGVASLGVPTAQAEGVAWWAHIGGFAFGLVVGWLLRGRARRRVAFSG
jgi:membrane associated rhomboid family serine protease